jgi:hypothetical protein
MRVTAWLATVTLLCASTAAIAQDNRLNGPRSDQQRGESSYIQQNETSGLGKNGQSRTEDIRRTATGDIKFTPQQIEQLHKAVQAAKLERRDSVIFTVAIGAAVPAQAGAKDLPPAVAKTLPTKTPMRYVLAQDRLILIDKKSGRIVGIVPGMS